MYAGIFVAGRTLIRRQLFGSETAQFDLPASPRTITRLMDQLRIGVIGLGAIAGSHLPQLRRRHEVIEIVAADPSPAAGEFAKKFSIARLVTDYREILDNVDAVLICTPTALHAPIAVEALSRGKAVFCEKPLARTLEQADAMIDAAKASGASRGGAPLQVGFVRRFDQEWLAWREAALSGSIGRPIVWRDIAASTGPAGKWFFDDAIGGGPFFDACIHSVDFGLHTFGSVQWVFCHGRTMKADATAIDTGTATLRFESGDELLLAWSWGLPAGCRGTRVFEMLGPKGLIHWPGDEAKGAAERRFLVTTGADASREVRFPGDALTPAYDRQMDEFVEVALGRKEPTVGAAAGREALRVAAAILESARSARVVNLTGDTDVKEQ